MLAPRPRSHRRVEFLPRAALLRSPPKALPHFLATAMVDVLRIWLGPQDDDNSSSYTWLGFPHDGSYSIANNDTDTDGLQSRFTSEDDDLVAPGEQSSSPQVPNTRRISGRSSISTGTAKP